MAEEIEGLETAAEASGTGVDPAAVALALGGASRAEADGFLRKQSRLTDLQIEQFSKSEVFELSHLHWRRFSDRVKGALQIMTLLLGAALVIGLGAAIWNASHADGLVIEAFAVPPQMAANGNTGEVVADDLTNKLIAIHDMANANSLGRSKDVQQANGEDIKVEIPETGVSVAQGWRYLRSWLGHERHLHGSLRTLGDGQIALTLDGADTVTFHGPAGSLDRLEQQAAEHAFGSVDAENYVVYLETMGRDADAQAAAAIGAQAATVDRADFYALWSAVTRRAGNFRLAVARERLAQAMDPKIGSPYFEAMETADTLGHDEEAMAQARKLGSVKEADQPVFEQGRGFRAMLDIAASDDDLNGGDFAAALTRPCDSCSAAELAIRHAGFAGRTHDAVRARAMIEETQANGSADLIALHQARYFADAAAGDWHAAAVDARAYGNALTMDGLYEHKLRKLTHVQPLLAIALAQAGDYSSAHAAIDGTPLDCYACVRARGTIRSAERQWNEAAFWYAEAIRQGPSLPFAYTDWGRMLLQKKDPEGAIAKFAIAILKSPHFADPLEGWGEALMGQNHADLALAKFEEATKYAPNWGGLHLKWGEALVYAGKRDEAKAQFTRAATLDLSPPEKSELARHP